MADLISILIQVGGNIILLVFFIILYRIIGHFPDPLPETENRTQELLEIIIVFIFIMVLRVFFWMGFLPLIRISSDFYLPISFFILLLIPLIIEIFIHKRSFRDLGIVGYAEKAWLPSVVVVGFGILWGLLKLIVGYPAGSSSLIRLIFLFLTPAIIEEWEFRCFYQTKLERTMNQKKALFIQGLMFGAMHIPNDFFGYYWQMGGSDPLFSILVLTLQIILGWIFGVVFLKARTIWPVIIAHYFLDFLNIILITFMWI